MNRRHFLAGLAALPFAVYLPYVETSAGLARGACCIQNAEQAQLIGATWWQNWTPRPTLDIPGFAPQIRDLSQMADLPDLQGYVRLFNEPNVSEQANMALGQVVDSIWTLVNEYPNALWGTPELFCDPTDYSHTDIVRSYRDKYGVKPPYSVICLHAYGWDHNEIIGKLTRQIGGLDDLGYSALPIWVTEWGGWPDANWAQCCYPTVMRKTLEWMRANPRIKRECWFPTYWNPEWNDPGGVDWTVCRLIGDGLTALGKEYINGA